MKNKFSPSEQQAFVKTVYATNDFNCEKPGIPCGIKTIKKNFGEKTASTNHIALLLYYC
jgi:hypothetical protein